MSKATRGLHVSEDVFAGIAHLIRGGKIKMVEHSSVGKVIKAVQVLRRLQDLLGALEAGSEQAGRQTPALRAALACAGPRHGARFNFGLRVENLSGQRAGVPRPRPRPPRRPHGAGPPARTHTHSLPLQCPQQAHTVRHSHLVLLLLLQASAAVVTCVCARRALPACCAQDLPRLLHLYHSGLGYFTNAMLTVAGVSWQLVTCVALALAEVAMVQPNGPAEQPVVVLYSTPLAILTGEQARSSNAKAP